MLKIQTLLSIMHQIAIYQLVLNFNNLNFCFNKFFFFQLSQFFNHIHIFNDLTSSSRCSFVVSIFTTTFLIKFRWNVCIKCWFVIHCFIVMHEKRFVNIDQRFRCFHCTISKVESNSNDSIMINYRFVVIFFGPR